MAATTRSNRNTRFHGRLSATSSRTDADHGGVYAASPRIRRASRRTPFQLSRPARPAIRTDQPEMFPEGIPRFSPIGTLGCRVGTGPERRQRR